MPSALAVPPAACESTCILNGGFEGPTCPANVPPAGWARYVFGHGAAHGPGQSCSVLAAGNGIEPHGGLAALRIRDPGAGVYSGVISTPVPAVPGEVFDAAVWVRQGQGGVSGLYVQFYALPWNPDLTPVGSAFSQAVLGAEWQEQTVRATAPPMANFAHLLLYSCAACGGFYYADDASLRRA